MAISDEMLGLAQQLLTVDPRRPKFINLRRAVSAAYYAVFHRLISDAVAGMVGVGPNVPSLRPDNLRTLRLDHEMARWFTHTQMKKASKWITSPSTAPKPIQALLTPGRGDTFISADLHRVASYFVDLQTARHQADYDPAYQPTRITAGQHVEKARDAFDLCNGLSTEPMYRLYLLLLLGVDKCATVRA